MQLPFVIINNFVEFSSAFLSSWVWSNLNWNCFKSLNANWYRYSSCDLTEKVLLQLSKKKKLKFYASLFRWIRILYSKVKKYVYSIKMLIDLIL